MEVSSKAKLEKSCHDSFCRQQYSGGHKSVHKKDGKRVARRKIRRILREHPLSDELPIVSTDRG